LHLNGRDQGFAQDFGFRPWMKTGITLTDNQDLSYMGLRQIDDGQLNVFASDLSTGVYTYSLVADGRAVMTKKMMKQ
jgi:hypothetical protein